MARAEAGPGVPPERIEAQRVGEREGVPAVAGGITRLLITGANGFVGRHAMRAFPPALAPGSRVAGLGRRPMPDVPEGAAYHRVDLLDADALARFVGAFRPTHVLHLAGLASVRQAMTRPAETWRGNLLSLLNLCEAIADGGPGATFLYVSSGEVYGRAFLCGTPVSEAVEPLPANGYARTKRMGEQMLCDILPAAGVKTLVLRPFNHLGPGQDGRFVAASFAGQIARIEAGRAEPVLEVGDLGARRDFLDVEDVVAAYLAVVAHAGDLPDGAVYNISSGRPRPVSEVLDGLRALSRVPFDIRTARDRLRPSEVQTASGDASALARAVGWRPRVAWQDSLARLLDDARARIADA